MAEERNTSSDLSEDDELIEPWENLIQYLTAQHLEKLCKIFHKTDAETFKKQPIRLSKEDFIKAVDTVVGNSQFSYQAISLFKEVPYPENEKITWLQLVKFYSDYASVEEHRSITLTIGKMIPVADIKIDSIARIVLMETPSSFSYAVVSKFGKIGIYDGNLDLLCTYQVIFARTDVVKLIKPRHRKTAWVNDAIFVPNLCLLIISTSTRSLMFYDAASLKHKTLCLIEGIPYAIQCFSYYFDPELKLLLGNDQGTLIIMKFLQQKDKLFRKKYSDKLNAYFWQELRDETDHVSMKTVKNLCFTSIESLFYCKDSKSVVVSSQDRKQAVIFYSLKENKKTYVFKIDQGATCFSTSHNLRVLITGSENGTILLWNSVVPSQPMAVFKEHKTSIVDVRILEQKRVALSLSKDGVLKVWDLNDQKCQQTLSFPFPAFDVLGKTIEWGKLPIHAGPKRFPPSAPRNIDVTITENRKCNFIELEDPWNRSDILISCCNFIAVVNIDYETGVVLPKAEVLPPPAMQNDVILPEGWKGEGPVEVTPPENEFEIEISDYVKTAMKEYKELNLFKNVTVEEHDINQRIAALEQKKIKMKTDVAHCAPYLALDLHEIDEPKLSENLPVPNHKKTQKIVDQTFRLLSAATLRSGILSDRSSRSRSSRSSVVEF